MDLWVVFLTGLTVGGVSCMAVQGGLLASTLAAREEEDIESGSKQKHGALPVLAFLVTKLAAYLLLGFILGAFGGALQISDSVRWGMQLVASFYMIAVALNLLNVHPIFRYVIIQPPRFLTKMVRNQSKSKDLFAPAFLGAMTIFIPCGTTIAMEALAISSGNAINGAAILGAFVLGTSPLFFVLGYATTALGDAFRARFLKLAAILVIYLGLSSLNGALVSAGFPLTWQSIVDSIPVQVNVGDEKQATQAQGPEIKTVDGVQVVDITAVSSGYDPKYVQVKNGVPVRLNLTAKGGISCSSSFTIPSLGIRKRLTQGETQVVDFTPTKPGKIVYTCSMGMYSGVIEVI